MAFTIEDLRDLLELLRAHPEWREPLWALLASEEVRRMPAELAALREATERGFRRAARLILALHRAQQRQARETDRRFAELAEAIRRLSEEFAAHRQEFLEHRREFQEHRQEFLEYRAETERRFAELAEAQRRTEENLNRLSEAFAAHRQEFLEYRAETERRFAELAEAQRRHYEEFAAHRQEFLEHRQEFLDLRREFQEHRQEFLEYRAETDRRFAELAETVRILTRRVGDLDGLVRGWIHEDRYRTRSRRYRRLVLDPHILSPEEREAFLRQMEMAGRLTSEEAAELEEADVLVRGRSRATGGEVFLVVEVSATVDTDDVERAVERAEMLRRAEPGAEVIPVVAGPAIHPRAAQAARAQGVWWLTDSRPYAPEEIPAGEGRAGPGAS